MLQRCPLIRQAKVLIYSISASYPPHRQKSHRRVRPVAALYGLQTPNRIVQGLQGLVACMQVLVEIYGM
jgi:hypothetical protein